MLLTPFPGPRDLYLLVIGMVIGVLLGPAVLGRASPWAYAEMFGGGTVVQQLEEFDQQTQDKLQSMPGTNATPQQVKAMLQSRQAERRMRAGAIEAMRDQRASGWAMAIMLAVVAVMAIETVVAPSLVHDRERTQVPRALPRLVSVRYALMGAWVAVVLARPTLLAQPAMVFAAVLIILSLGLGLVPLGPEKKAGGQEL